MSKSACGCGSRPSITNEAEPWQKPWLRFGAPRGNLREGARLCALLRARTDIRIVRTRKGEVRLRMWFSSLMNKQSGAMAKAIAPLWRSAREFARGRKALRVAPSPNRHPHRADKERRSPPADVVLVPHEQAKRSHGKSHGSALALREGLEPPILRSEGECSIQLN